MSENFYMPNATRANKTVLPFRVQKAYSLYALDNTGIDLLFRLRRVDVSNVCDDTLSLDAFLNAPENTWTRVI